jgi:hypothetical protein
MLAGPGCGHSEVLAEEQVPGRQGQVAVQVHLLPPGSAEPRPRCGLRLDVTAGRRLACRPGVYQRPPHGPSARHPAAAVWEAGATVLARMAQQPEKVISAVLACGPSGPPRDWTGTAAT